MGVLSTEKLRAESYGAPLSRTELETEVAPGF